MTTEVALILGIISWIGAALVFISALKPDIYLNSIGATIAKSAQWLGISINLVMAGMKAGLA